MRRIDALHLEYPLYGSRKIAQVLSAEGLVTNRKCVQRLMRVMELESMAPKPNTSRSAAGHPTYPYLLRGLKITRINQVWAADITYIASREGVRVPGRDHRLAQPLRTRLAALEHARHQLLCGRTAGGPVAARQARHL
jgi:transposase InsO family protein